MDPATLQAWNTLFHNQLTTQVALTGLITLLAAGVGSYLAAYLRKKAERKADREAFGSLLQEEFERTLQTEQVKNSLTAATTKSLDRFRTQLQQHSDFVTFQRELIARYQGNLVSSLGEIATAADLAKFQWFDTRLDELKVKMMAELRLVSISASLLATLSAISHESAKACADDVEAIGTHWIKVISELVKDDPRYRAQYPNAPSLDSETFWTAHGNLIDSIGALQRHVLEIARVMVVPA